MQRRLLQSCSQQGTSELPQQIAHGAAELESDEQEVQQDVQHQEADTVGAVSGVDMKNLLTDTYHKKSPTKLLNIIKKYSQVPKHLLPDLKTYRIIVQTRSINPTNTLQRIDRLIDFIKTLNR